MNYNACIQQIIFPKVFEIFLENSRTDRKSQETNSFLTKFKQILLFPNIFGIVFVKFCDILGRFFDCQCN